MAAGTFRHTIVNTTYLVEVCRATVPSRPKRVSMGGEGQSQGFTAKYYGEESIESSGSKSDKQ